MVLRRRVILARALFSIPFMGLNSDGMPMVLNEKGQVTTDDINFQERTKTDFLKYEGPTDPPHTGSLGNMFTYRGFRLNVFFTYASVMSYALILSSVHVITTSFP